MIIYSLVYTSTQITPVFELISSNWLTLLHVLSFSLLVACSLAVLCADESDIDEEVTLENTPIQVSQTEACLYVLGVWEWEIMYHPQFICVCLKVTLG